MTTPAQHLARRVLHNVLDSSSPLTPAAVAYTELFDLLRVDEAAATAVIYEAAEIIADATTDLLTRRDMTLEEIIAAHT